MPRDFSYSCCLPGIYVHGHKYIHIFMGSWGQNTEYIYQFKHALGPTLKEKGALDIDIPEINIGLPNAIFRSLQLINTSPFVLFSPMLECFSYMYGWCEVSWVLVLWLCVHTTTSARHLMKFAKFWFSDIELIFISYLRNIFTVSGSFVMPFGGSIQHQYKLTFDWSTCVSRCATETKVWAASELFLVLGKWRMKLWDKNN